MAAVWTIVGKDLRQRLRDRTVLLFGVVAPLVLAVALGVVFGGLDEQVNVELGLAGGDGPLATPLTEQVLPALEDDGLVSGVVQFDDAAAARTAVETGDVDAAIVLSAQGATVVGHADRPTSASIAEAVVASVATEAEVIGAVATTAAALGTPVTVQEAVAAAAAAPGIRLVDTPVGVAPLDAVTGVAAGISVFFLFFAVSIAVTGILEERQTGTLARLRTAPIPAWAPLAAKALAAFLVGVASMVVLAVATTLLLDADWGAPGPLLVVIVAAVAAATGLVSLVASFGRTQESANGAQGVVNTVLGAVGGSFFPIAGGGLLAVISQVTPHSWFLTGVRQTAGGAPWPDVLGTAGVLLAMAVVTGALAALRFRSTLEV